jgi:predicted RNA methylase
MLDYHRTLLDDETRTNALREAISRVVRNGDVVADLGAGTGILSFFACDAGARRVFAIEREHLADVVSFLSRHLRHADRVTVLHDVSTNIELPELANVLITETIGAAGLDENIIGFVIDARKRLLRENATILPRSISLIATPADIHEQYQRHVGFWDEAQGGYDFSPLRVFASNSMLLLHIKAESHLAKPAELVNVDLTTVESTLVDGSATYVTTRSGTVHGFALWFRAALVDSIVLTNREKHSPSWAQAFFPLEEPVKVKPGTTITLDLQTDDGKSWRWRGNVGDVAFDQMTLLNRPPCNKPE